jgi:drug/metabolite transporter (DMT)-like permease
MLLLVAALAFATSGPLGKVAHGIPPITVAALRTGIAAVVLAALAPKRLARSLRALERRQLAGVLLAGALLGAHFACFLAGLAATSLVSAVALISLEPIAVVLSAFFFFGLRPTRRETIGLIVATLGALVVASGAGIGEHRTSGDLLVLAAVVLFGVYVASARGLRDAMPATPYAAAVYGSASLVLAPVALGLGLGAPTMASSSAVLALALVPTLIGHTVVQRAARHAPPALVALVCPGETVFGLIIGAALMRAWPTSREGLGAALVVAGASLTIFGRQSSSATTGA